MICVCFIWREHQKAQPKVFLEKPGLVPATPGLQDIGLSLTPRRRRNSHFETDQVK